MKPRVFILLITVLIGLLTTGPQPAHAQTPQPVVRVVLFYSPACGHCEYVITEVLPPIFERFGSQLEMIGIDVTQADGQAVFYAALEKYGQLEHAAVPFLVIGEHSLIGSADIPEQFPGLIERYLAQGGVDWPEIPGFAGLMVAAESTQAALPSPTSQQTASASPESVPPADPEPAAESDSIVLTGEIQASLADRLAQDPAGNGLAILVLVGMLISLGWGGWHFHRAPGRRMTGIVPWVVLALCVTGLGVAGYLSYVEMTHVEAVCGPVGDCNTVQQSEYARLFGILPIGVLGIAGYIMIIAACFIGLYTKGRSADYAALAMLAMTVFGTLFSIYLTFLEPFVIGATCAWCLASAVIMTGLMLLSLAPGKQALDRWIPRYKR